MEFVNLPEFDIPVSRLGLGGCPLGGHGWGPVDDQELRDSIQTALDGGVNFFDTADIYGLGQSEEILSQSLGDDRHNLVIASKFGVRRENGTSFYDNSPSYMRQALSLSLKRLRLERLPLYYLHWPDGKTPIEEIVEAMEQCRQQGLIGAIGLSNVNSEQLKRACRVAPISAVQTQYSLVDREEAEALSATLKKHSVPMVTWGSLSQGLLTGKFNQETKFPADDRRSRYDNFQGERFLQILKQVERLKRVANQHGKTPGQTAMRWLLDTPHVGSVLFGAKRPAQVLENLAAVDWTIREEEHQQLSNHASQLRKSA